MALLEFSVTPLGAGESVGEYVARCVDIVRESGLDYELHAMGTVVEGELSALLELLERCCLAVAADCNRVTCSAKLDIRKNHSGQLKSKVASVERRLQSNILEQVVQKQVVGDLEKNAGESTS
jgi:uncharacterized protein (TIGR00106 family)